MISSSPWLGVGVIPRPNLGDVPSGINTRPQQPAPCRHRYIWTEGKILPIIHVEQIFDAIVVVVLEGIWDAIFVVVLPHV